MEWRWAVAKTFGERFGMKPIFIGEEAGTALLSDASRCVQMLGAMEVDEEKLMEMTAHWLGAGMATLGKPTGFERRDGQF